MGMKALAMSERLLKEVLQAQLGTSVGKGEEGIPDDAHIIGARMLWNGIVEFKLISESYSEEPEGTRVPWLGGRFLT